MQPRPCADGIDLKLQAGGVHLDPAELEVDYGQAVPGEEDRVGSSYPFGDPG